MPLSVQFSVTGVDDIVNNLNTVAQSVKDFQTNTPTQIAEEMVQQMQDQAPVDTGYLRDHITSEDAGDGRATVTSEAEYSVYVEFGTKKMQAEPFFYPVVDQYGVQTIIQKFNESVSLS